MTMPGLDDPRVHEFICEVDDFTQNLTNQEAFDAGWDYPPFMGVWGVVSPRTCPDHGIDDSAWWAIQTGQPLSERQVAFCKKVTTEGVDDHAH